METDMYVSVRQAAAIFGVAKSTVYRWLEDGVLPYIQVDKIKILLAEDVRAWAMWRRDPRFGE